MPAPLEKVVKNRAFRAPADQSDADTLPQSAHVGQPASPTPIDTYSQEYVALPQSQVADPKPKLNDRTIRLIRSLQQLVEGWIERLGNDDWYGKPNVTLHIAAGQLELLEVTYGQTYK